MDKVVAHIVMGVDGMAKNINAISKFDIVRVVNEKSKKPDPRLLIPGGADEDRYEQQNPPKE